MANMDAQTVQAVGDTPNTVIIELGRNDDLMGDMAALQAEVEENLIELKAGAPLRQIYFMNVLPTWTAGGVPIDFTVIRNAISAACVAQSVTCWDTYTVPWIDFADTTDGTHPTAAGHAKIATQVLARL